MMPVDEVWGIGRKMTVHLTAMNIETAWDLAQADAWTLRKQYSVVVKKTARELRLIKRKSGIEWPGESDRKI